MKLIIAGTRTLTPTTHFIDRAVDEEFLDRPISMVLCGCGGGVDVAGAHWAQVNEIKVRHYPADWNRAGKGAGPQRNGLMAKDAEALLLIWDGQSPGSASMKREALKRGLLVAERIVKA